MAVDFESAASANVCETAARVTVFVIGISELKLKEMFVEGQGSKTEIENATVEL